MSHGGFDVTSIAVSAKRKLGHADAEQISDPSKKFKAVGSSEGLAVLPDKGEEKTPADYSELNEDEDDDQLPEDGDLDAILKLVDEAPEIKELDAVAVKAMVTRLEKTVNANVQMRTKFPNKPDRFMDSEVALDEAITAIQPLAAAGFLYSEFVKLGAPSILLSLVGHENVDIGIAVVNLLHEMMDVETLAEEEGALDIVDGLLEHNGLEVLVNSLAKLDEKNKEDFTAFHNLLAIFEALIEVKANMAQTICSSTKLLKLLFARLKKDGFDENKLYASELIAILLQGCNDSIRNNLGEGTSGGLITILKAIHKYRRKDPETEEETEYVENLFGALCSTLHNSPKNQIKFAQADGIQLMVAVIRKKKFAKHGAIKSLNFATLNCVPNLEKLVDVGGLKTLFWFFMKRQKGKSDKTYEQEDEEHVMSIITQCFLNMADVRFLRLIRKFQENEFQKVERLMELYNKYYRKVEDAEIAWRREHPFHRRKKVIDSEAGAKEQAEADEAEYMRRIEAGLFSLQNISLTLGFVATAGDKKMIARLVQLLNQQDSSLNAILKVLEEFRTQCGEGDDEKLKLRNVLGAICEYLHAQIQKEER